MPATKLAPRATAPKIRPLKMLFASGQQHIGSVLLHSSLHRRLLMYSATNQMTLPEMAGAFMRRAVGRESLRSPHIWVPTELSDESSIGAKPARKQREPRVSKRKARQWIDNEVRGVLRDLAVRDWTAKAGDHLAAVTKAVQKALRSVGANTTKGGC